MQITREQYRKHLEQNSPELYQKMVEDGRLNPYLDMRTEQAKRYYDQMMRTYAIKNPIEEKMQQADYLNNQQMWAEQQTGKMLFGEDYQLPNKPTMEN